MTELFQIPADPAAPSAGDIPIPIETVDVFESIDQLGMMDHTHVPETTTEPAPEEPPPPLEDMTFSSNLPEAQCAPDITAEHSPELPPIDFTPIESATLIENEPFLSPMEAESKPVLDQIQTYSEQTRSVVSELPVFYPFHLLISGEFGPFERDKLLLFITENPIGLASADLDLQINSGRVFLPRISEYAGIKVIQELRDSGLQFSLTPSHRDPDEPPLQDTSTVFRYDGSAESTLNRNTPVPVLLWKPELLDQYQEIDTLQVNQFFKAEMVEAEKSELFQELIDRMMASLKQKARIKGGDALTKVEQNLSRLQLPSQYQVSIQAVILKKK